MGTRGHANIFTQKMKTWNFYNTKFPDLQYIYCSNNYSVKCETCTVTYYAAYTQQLVNFTLTSEKVL